MQIIWISALAIATPATGQRLMQPVPIGNPAEWFGPDSYPPEAIRANRQGRVVVTLGIDSTGAVATCTVKQSSGTTVLDEGTCAVAREHARFNPGTDRNGHPVAGEYTLPVVWQMPGSTGPTFDAADVPARSTLALESFINAEGVVASCRVIEAVGLRGTDPCSGRVGRRSMVVSRGGKPVSYRIVQRSTQEVILGDAAAGSPSQLASEEARRCAFSTSDAADGDKVRSCRTILQALDSAEAAKGTGGKTVPPR